MATLVSAAVSRSGLNLNTLDVPAAGGGDDFVNSGIELLYIKNADASPKTVTIVTPATQDALAVADRAVVVPAGNEMLIGPFPTSIYNDANGKVSLTYSAVTNVTVGVVQQA